MLAIQTLLLVVGLSGIVMADGQGEGSCDLNDIPVMTDFDPERATGRFYIKYRSHSPAYISALGVTSTAFDQAYELSMDKDYLLVNRSFVLDDESCIVAPTLRMKVDQGVAVGEEEQLPNGDTSQTTGYILGTDYESTTSIYFHVKVNGVFSEDDSTIDIMVHDAKKEPDMDVIEDALEAFCGEDASDLDFFVKFNNDEDGHARCLGPAKK